MMLLLNWKQHAHVYHPSQSEKPSRGTDKTPHSTLFLFLLCSCRLILFPGQCAAEKLNDLCVAAGIRNLRSVTAALSEDEEVKEGGV